MSTPRLTEEEVHAACADIAGQGERPTALTLLDKLGRGSLTTITKYLNSWNASEEAHTLKADALPTVVKLPEELSKEGEDLVKKMWHVAKVLTDAELDIQREALKQAELTNQAKVEEAFKFSEAQSMKIERLEDIISELKARLTEEQSDHAGTVVQLNEAEKANVGLTKDNERLGYEVAGLKNQVAGLEETNKEAIQERQALQKSHEMVIKQKDQEIRALDVQVHTVQSSLDAAISLQNELKAELKDKGSELSKCLSELEKMTIRHDALTIEVSNAKTEMKVAHKIASDAEKKVSNLEGQLEVYKTLDKGKAKSDASK